jgi:hypothetical protein
MRKEKLEVALGDKRAEESTRRMNPAKKAQETGIAHGNTLLALTGWLTKEKYDIHTKTNTNTTTNIRSNSGTMDPLPIRWHPRNRGVIQ